jgi:threonine synthase
MESEELDPVCERCGSSLVLVGRTKSIARDAIETLPPGVWRYKELLPPMESESVVSLGEGGTPLLPAKRLGRELGLTNLLIKDETRNPTGSFIDRGATIVVSLAKERGFEECGCLTTGNLGASLGAYCAKAGILARITISPSTDMGKLYQMLAYGAQIEAQARHKDWRPSNAHSLRVTAGNPYLLEGEKTTGFEIVHDLGWGTPDAIVVPVGTGGHLSMIWEAMVQLKAAGLMTSVRSRLVGVQFPGSANMMSPPPAERRSGSKESPYTELEESEPYFIEEARRSMRESRGAGLVTSVEDAVRATAVLARTEGIFAEPASASVIACVRQALKTGVVKRDDCIVCVITGAGLKDTKAVSRLSKAVKRVPLRAPTDVARMQVGETKLDILQLLVEGETYGYALWQAISMERSITTASIYQHLEELEVLGLVRKLGADSRGGRERVPYELTRKGSDFLRVAGELEKRRIK